MRKRNILFICVCLLSFCSYAFSQDAPKAVKFDEYFDEAANFTLLTEKAGSFFDKLSKEPATTKGFIVFLNGSSKLKGYRERYSEVYAYLNSLLSKDEKFTKERILPMSAVLASNRSEFSRIEFWFIPLNAENPYPPLVCAYCLCPQLELVGDNSVYDKNKPRIFSISISGGSDFDIEYNWTVSAGEISSGQGTPLIAVDFSKVRDNEEVTVAIEIDGFCTDCESKKELKVKIVNNPK